MWNAVVQHHLIQFPYLTFYVRGLIRRVLQENAAHNDFQRVTVLVFDGILVVGCLVDTPSNAVLNDPNVLFGKESTGKVRVFPLAYSRLPQCCTLIRRYFVVNGKKFANIWTFKINSASILLSCC